jgi:poly(glycerol-phosphate) alpha-glucosyltransferase
LDAVSRLVQSQQQQGLEVKVFGLWDEMTDLDIKTWNPVPVSASMTSWPKALGRSPQLLQKLQEFAPDITHTHGLWLYSSIATKHYCRKQHRPYMVSPHGMLDPWAMKHSHWKKMIAYQLFEHEHLRGARCLRALCVSEARSIRQLQLPNDIAVIPNGVDLPAGAVPAAPPWQAAIEPGKKVLLFLSRIHPKKGLVNLLKAWAKLQNSDGPCRQSEWGLAIAGWDQGGHEQELKQLASDLGLVWEDIRDRQSVRHAGKGKPALVNGKEFPLSDYYHPAYKRDSQAPCSLLFLGPCFDEVKAACYHYCDAFVLPSFSEGLPMVVLDAWARAKPVVATPACNLPEGFSVGAAIRTEPTETDLVAGLKELLQMSDAKRSEMGCRGRDLVAQRFTWAQVAKQMQAVQLWILGGGPKPDCVLSGAVG